MAFSGRFFGIVVALLLGAGPGWAAGPTREQRAFDTAVAAFHDGLWNIAELEFSEFAQKYPASALVPQAGVLQAQAAIKQDKFAAAESLLTALRPKAGPLADDCTYWLGEAQYQRGDWRTAEVTLASVSTNSPLALQATVEAGAAMARLEQWTQLKNLFQMDQNLFLGAEQTEADNEMVLRGRLLLAEANFAQKQYDAAAGQLATIKAAVLPPELEWKRVYLLCEVKLEVGELETALALATNLVAAAQHLSGANATDSLPASVALRAKVLEQLDRPADAMADYAENLSPSAPEDRQREAILKISALAIAQQQFTNAETELNNYATQFTNAPALDIAWLTLGELYLHDYASQPGATNLLATARGWFSQLLNASPNSGFVGKAYLDRGWCGWLELMAENTNRVAGAGTNSPAFAGCLADFQSAAAILPPSEDLAVARFKLADTFFAQEDYADALNNYQAVLHFTNDFPQVAQSLEARALYQSLRAQLQLGTNTLAGASNTMAQIVAAYPVNGLSESGALLLGEGYTDLRDPTNALAVFKIFLDRAPHSGLEPNVKLAMARAYEEEQNWPDALAQYAGWLHEFPTNDLLPQALYAQAWATFQAGDETNALMLFTNFVAQFPMHALAPMGQWWVAEHYFRLGDSKDAEVNYKTIFQNTNWLDSALFYPAQIMAGRAAVALTENAEAIRDYFQILEDDTNCPLSLRVQATFLHGSALMKMDSPDTNNPTTNFSSAVTVFNRICQSYPTNETGARAWGLMGDCYLQLDRYDYATNAYWQALTWAATNAAVESQARIGLGIALEKKAALTPGSSQKLLDQAEDNYWNVLQGASDAEPSTDMFWTKVAGLKAAQLAEGLGEWGRATNYYGKLLKLMPELQGSLARKIDTANQHLNAPNR